MICLFMPRARFKFTGRDEITVRFLLRFNVYLTFMKLDYFVFAFLPALLYVTYRLSYVYQIFCSYLRPTYIFEVCELYFVLKYFFVINITYICYILLLPFCYYIFNDF